MTFVGHLGSYIENMKMPINNCFMRKIDGHSSTSSIKHQNLFRCIVSSEINQNIAVMGLMRPVCHPIRHVFDIFDFREI